MFSLVNFFRIHQKVVNTINHYYFICSNNSFLGSNIKKAKPKTTKTKDTTDELSNKKPRPTSENFEKSTQTLQKSFISQTMVAQLNCMEDELEESIVMPSSSYERTEKTITLTGNNNTLLVPKSTVRRAKSLVTKKDTKVTVFKPKILTNSSTQTEGNGESKVEYIYVTKEEGREGIAKQKVKSRTVMCQTDENELMPKFKVKGKFVNVK